MRQRRASTVYLFLKGAWSLFIALVYTVELVYQVQTIGLNPLQLILAGTVQQGTIFLLQTPTGALADMYSRRWAVVLGLCLQGTGFLLEGTIPAFAAVLGAQALYGFGLSLMDGADAAWIADELGPAHTGQVYLRATQIGWLATIPGIVASAALGSLRLSLPLIVGGATLFALGVVLAVIMPEHHFTPVPRQNQRLWRQMSGTVRLGVRAVRHNTVLLAVVAVGALFGVHSAVFGQLWQYHLLHTFVFPPLTLPGIGRLAPVVWFGIIETVIALSSVIGIELTKRTVDTESHTSVAWSLFVLNAMLMAGVIGFALAGSFGIALGAFWLVTAAGGPRLPLQQAWMNQNVDSSVRATVFSLRAQVNALAGIVGGPLLGALATVSTTRVALLASAVVVSPALLLYARTARRQTPARLATARDAADAADHSSG